MTTILKVILDKIRVSAEEYYPNECCGLLLGAGGRIAEIRPVENASPESRGRRYLISPIDLLHADNYARQAGLEIIGIYHSHPDHPARPSEFDREHAILNYLYLIVKVAGGKAGDITGWRLTDWDAPFTPEDLAIVDEPEPIAQ